MNWQALFEDHLRELDRATPSALAVSAAEGMSFDTLVVHAGRLATSHGDELEVPFRTHPHFLRFAPVPGPDHLLVYRPNRPVQLLRAAAKSFWHAGVAELDDWLQQALEVT